MDAVRDSPTQFLLMDGPTLSLSPSPFIVQIPLTSLTIIYKSPSSAPYLQLHHLPVQMPFIRGPTPSPSLLFVQIPT